MSTGPRQPRRARIALAGLAAVALTLLATPAAVGAYPPQQPLQLITVDTATTVCEGPNPVISYSISATGFDPSVVPTLTATITILNSSGTAIAGPFSGLSLTGTLPYPGTGAALPGLVLKAEVNPVATKAVQQPPSSAACLSPAAATDPEGIRALPSALPDTGGADPTQMLVIAASTLLVGAMIVVASRRRDSVDGASISH